MESPVDKCRKCPLIESCQEIVNQTDNPDMLNAYNEFITSLLEDCPGGPSIESRNSVRNLGKVIIYRSCVTPRTSLFPRRDTRKRYEEEH